MLSAQLTTMYSSKGNTTMKERDVFFTEEGFSVDAKDITVDTALSDWERMADFIQKIGNPYRYLSYGIPVKVRFAGKMSLEDCICETLFLDVEE